MKLPQRFLASEGAVHGILSAPNKASRKMKDCPSSAAPAPSQARCVVFQPDREDSDRERPDEIRLYGGLVRA